MSICMWNTFRLIQPFSIPFLNHFLWLCLFQSISSSLLESVWILGFFVNFYISWSIVQSPGYSYLSSYNRVFREFIFSLQIFFRKTKNLWLENLWCLLFSLVANAYVVSLGWGILWFWYETNYSFVGGSSQEGIIYFFMVGLNEVSLTYKLISFSFACRNETKISMKSTSSDAILIHMLTGIKST